MINFFQILKEATHDVHKEIELCIPVLRPDLQIDELRSHLRRVFGFYQPLENKISIFIDQHGDEFEMKRRYKSSLLVNDLIGWGDSRESIHSIHTHSELNDISSLTDLVATLYVLEGSTLGNQIICRALSKNLNVSAFQMSFYEGYGADTYSRWRSFKAQAETHTESLDIDLAIKKSREIFQQFTIWLKGNQIPDLAK
ncbi:MAG: biliverdin-producing heme oxygenase [Bdellovibrionaceae bacterium]|nr:biliverdin-producing heme oxygenase [Pseudobdellovibrionaceae bacterium]